MTTGHSNLEEFYEGRSLLVTGATGFMGKVLVEKLLRSCPRIERIYALVRPKRGMDVNERVQELLSSKIFDNLKKQRPDAVAKVIAVRGDISLPDLGIGSRDERTLVENVSVVFHVAATVKFNEGLKKSICMNARGTKQVLRLCQQMKKLVSMVHVSTAYCNCDRKEIEETVYDFPHNPYELMNAMEWMSGECVDAIQPHLLGARPNTYTYTKALAEALLVAERGSVPVAIIRPSIVGPTWKEPVPGWIDCLNAVSGLILGYGKGALRSGYCNPDMGMDIVPADVCTNLMIAAAWYSGTYRANDVSVFNCTSGSTNRTTYGEVFDHFARGALKYPLENVVWYPSMTLRRSKGFSDFVSIFVHFLPAYVLDAVGWAFGRKPFLVDTQRRIQKGCSCLEYFGNNEWRFSTSNVAALTEALSENDRKEFDFNQQPMDWASYCEQCFLGAKIYLLKDDVDRLPAARRHLKRMYYLRHLTHAIVLLFVWRLFMALFHIF